MKNSVQVLIVCLVLISLNACKEDYLKPDNELDRTDAHADTLKSGNGLLIASVTNGVREAVLAKPLNSSLFYIVKADDVDEYNETRNNIYKSPTVEYFTLDSDTYSSFGRKSQLEKYAVDGMLNVLELPYGEYALVNWTSSGRPKSFYPVDFYTQYFTIKENAATYIGNLHIETLYGRNIFGMTIDGGAEPMCEDKSDRDFEFFQENYQRYSSLEISKQIVACRMAGELFSR